MHQTQHNTVPAPQNAAFQTLAAAIAEDRITPALQPVISTRRGNLPAFSECLARIIGRNGVLMSAGPLIGAVETTDMGRLVDRLMLRKVLHLLSANPGQRLSINLSACGVGDMDWLAILQDADRRTPGIGEWLIVEITETASLELDHSALDFLYELRHLGVSLALDDFGTGHTTLKQLGKFRFDFLKIDASLCHNLWNDRQRLTLLRSILRISRHFDLVTVAEGVETARDAEFLTEEGVDCLQGFFIGEPVAVSVMIEHDASAAREA